MDATPNFGVTMIPEVPSNPQLTLAIFSKFVSLFLRTGIREQEKI